VHLFLLLPIRKKVLHSSKKEAAAEADASILEILEFGGGERERAWLLLAACCFSSKGMWVMTCFERGRERLLLLLQICLL
jgi:hypothetical protein